MNFQSNKSHTIPIKSAALGFLILLSLTFGWSQNNEVQGPYYPANGNSTHNAPEVVTPSSVQRTQQLIAKMSSARSACSDLNVSFSTSFPAGADTAMEFAMSIWESEIESTVPITIEVEFIDLASTIMADTKPDGYFTIGSPGLPNTLYARALAEKITGSEIGGANSRDIIISVNDADYDFYFGLDANPGTGQVDFVTLMLHNIGHGLGFIGFGITDGTEGSVRDTNLGIPSIYDTLVENGSGTSILSFADPSVALHAELTSDDLFSGGTNATAANGGAEPKIYSPDPFSFFESYDHLDSSEFPAGTINSLMTETLGLEQANHNIGPVALGVLEDMGWSLCETLSIGQNELVEFSILENPVKQTLTIQLNSSLIGADLDVVVYNISGKRVAGNKHTYDGNSFEVPGISNLANGLYFVSLKNADGGESITKKFIKN